MKFSWGNRILMVILLFIGGMGYLVYRCLHTDYELVSNEYYNDELKYQHVIDASKNSQALADTMSIKSVGGGILLKMPSEMKAAPVKGTVYFYCARSSAQDRKFALELDSSASQLIDKSKLETGTYTVKVNWEMQGKSYYAEQLITL